MNLHDDGRDTRQGDGHGHGDGPVLPPGLRVSIPLDEARILQTVSRARRSAHSRFLRPVLALMLLPLVLLASLLATGGYRWDGYDPDTMTFGNAIQVIDEFETYHFENARSAQMRLWRCLDHALDDMHRWGMMTPLFRDVVLDALDNPQPPSAWYGGGFEPLRDKIVRGEPLTEIDYDVLGRVFAAGISAIRRLGSVHPRHQVYADLLVDRLRQKTSR